jgi:hypothetical protein
MLRLYVLQYGGTDLAEQGRRQRMDIVLGPELRGL